MANVTITKDSYITIGATVVICVFLCGLAWRFGSWQQSLTGQMDAQRKLIQSNSDGIDELNKKIVGRSEQGWHKYNQKIWAAELQRTNPGIEVPPVHNEFE